MYLGGFIFKFPWEDVLQKRLGKTKANAENDKVHVTM